METTAETLSLIELRGVVKIYTSEAGNFTALKGIDAQVMPGEFLGIIGKSGAGKSTLLNMMTGIDHPASGTASTLPVKFSHNGQKNLTQRTQGFF